MRGFSFFIAIATFALSANAISPSKRAVNDNIQSCINGLNAADRQLLVLKSAVDSFAGTEGFLGVFAINNKEQPLEALIKTANTACCAVTTVSDKEASAVFDLIENMLPDITGSLDSLITKKPDFEAVPLASTFLKVDIKALSDLLKTLDGCLLAAAPKSYLAKAQAYIDEINAKLATAFTAYGIEA